MKVSELRQDQKNANKGTQRGRETVAASLKQFGAGRSVLLDRDGNLIAGNKTAEQASAAGMDVIIVPSDGTKLIAVQRTDLSIDDPKARGLAIADNRTSELGLDWDVDVLKALAPDLDLQPYFSTDELAELLGITAGGATGDEDDAPDAPEREAAVTIPGELILLGAHRLLCGDATSVVDVERLLDGIKPDMVNTDPPYGIKATHADGKVGHGGYGPGAKKGKYYDTPTYAPIIGDDSIDTAVAAYNLCAAMDIPVMIWWGGNHYSEALPSSSCWIVWDKQNYGNDFADAELAWTNQKTAVRIFQHMWNGMLKASERGERRCHPTQKPVALAEWCFEKYGKDCKTVLDLFGGSGSTLLACEKTKRSCYMMEMSPEYCDVIVNRWEKLTGKLAGRSK